MTTLRQGKGSGLSRTRKSQEQSLGQILLKKGPPIRRALLLAAVFSVPVFFLTTTYDPFNVPKLALLVVSTGTVALIRTGEIVLGARPDGLRRLVLPGAFLCVPLMAAWVASEHQEWSLFGQYPRFQGLIPYLLVALFGLLLADAFVGRGLALAWALASAGGVVGGYTMIQMLGLDPVSGWSAEGVSIVFNGSTIGHPNFTGGFLAIALPHCIYLWVKAPVRRKWAMVLTILTADGLIGANSQGGWAAGIAGIAVLAGSLAGKRWPPARLVGGSVALVAAVAAAGSVALSMIRPDLPLVGGSIQSRGFHWKAAVEMGTQAPVLGHGPNVYALEGVRYRPMLDALMGGYGKADDAHSVFLSYLANAGVIGALGYLAVFTWTLRRGLELSRHGSLGAAFFASASAYFVQSLVSIDEPSLRTAFWTALAGLVVVQGTEQVGEEQPGRKEAEGLHWARSRSTARSAGALALAAAGLAGSLFWSAGWLVADDRVKRGVRLLNSERVQDGRRLFELALGFRDEPRYRELYAEALGLAALRRGERGAGLMGEMRRVNAYLEELPETRGLLASARILHYWDRFDREADQEALELFKKALALDPHNPLIRVEMSEVLLDLGRTRQAVAVLQPLTASLDGASPEFWGALAVARLEAGDEPGARDAARRATRLDWQNCRALIAEEVLRMTKGGGGTRPRPGTALILRLTCDAGLYGVFLDRLPAPARRFYT